MKFVARIVGRSRVRAARQRLAKDPSPLAYVLLANECAACGMVRDARRVCEEGLAAYPGSAELKRMAQRANRIEAEERLKELRVELAEAPRPALRREICEILLTTGMIADAERQAAEWVQEDDDVESRLMHARTLVERYLSDRSRKSGSAAMAMLDRLADEAPREIGPWELRLRTASAIGAWREARRAAAQLLGLRPGDPALEARFRSLDAMSDSAPTLEQAMLAVERTGELADEGTEGPSRADGTRGTSDVRGLLRAMAEDPSVHAAFYVRGGTALVQGQKGATAERAARAVRSVLKTSRATARRLGLGPVYKIELAGEFGTLALAPGEMDAGAVWCRGALPAETERGLVGIAGLDATMGEVSA